MAFRYTTSMIISTRRILLATDDRTNKRGKIKPASIIASKDGFFITFIFYLMRFRVPGLTFNVAKQMMLASLNREP